MKLSFIFLRNVNVKNTMSSYKPIRCFYWDLSISEIEAKIKEWEAKLPSEEKDLTLRRLENTLYYKQHKEERI